MRFTRRSRHLTNGESDCITLQFYRSGSIRGALDDGTPLLMDPSRISIHDFAHPYCGVGASSEQYGVVIPRHRLEAHERIYRRPMFSWGVNSPQGRLLVSALGAIWRELPRATQDEAGALASGFIGLLNGLLAAAPDPADQAQVERTALAAMKDFLRANLHRTDLSAEVLCRQFHCSRATLYRLFKEDGGVMAYLRDLRLGRCFRELALGSGSSGKRVGEVAERWGFFDSSHFHRHFRKRFGIAPSDVVVVPGERELLLPDNPEIAVRAEIDRLRDWLQHV
jgi:AraC-like DNA-binding protein